MFEKVIHSPYLGYKYVTLFEPSSYIFIFFFLRLICPNRCGGFLSQQMLTQPTTKAFLSFSPSIAENFCLLHLILLYSSWKVQPCHIFFVDFFFQWNKCNAIYHIDYFTLGFHPVFMFPLLLSFRLSSPLYLYPLPYSYYFFIDWVQ